MVFIDIRAFSNFLPVSMSIKSKKTRKKYVVEQILSFLVDVSEHSRVSGRRLRTIVVKYSANRLDFGPPARMPLVRGTFEASPFVDKHLND